MDRSFSLRHESNVWDGLEAGIRCDAIGIAHKFRSWNGSYADEAAIAFKKLNVRSWFWCPSIFGAIIKAEQKKNMSSGRLRKSAFGDVVEPSVKKHIQRQSLAFRHGQAIRFLGWYIPSRHWCRLTGQNLSSESLRKVRKHGLLCSC